MNDCFNATIKTSCSFCGNTYNRDETIRNHICAACNTTTEECPECGVRKLKDEDCENCADIKAEAASLTEPESEEE